MKNKKIVLIGLNSAWNLVNFRMSLVKELIKQGYEVKVFAPYDSMYVKIINQLGCQFLPLDIRPRRANPIHELLLLLKIIIIFYRTRPHIYLGFTIKPNIYGAIASAIFKVRCINNISGLGTVFIVKNWLTMIAIILYRFALKSSERVFFQNADDKNLFIEAAIIKQQQADVLPGSGVDLSKFKAFPRDFQSDFFQFLFVGRIIPEKGFFEFVEAAKIVKSTFKKVEFAVLGSIDQDKRAPINQRQIDLWVSKGLIKYLGVTNDTSRFINNSDCVVLPSYREGVPKALLEAGAMSKPIIATDVPGCRDVVDHGINGFLCRPKDVIDLALKMKNILEMSDIDLVNMGKRGREKILSNFDEKIVVDMYLRALL